MSTRKILTMRREDYILDKTSDRYRECLHCGEPFMATHRLRKFCDNANWCHDEYNNDQKRKKETKAFDGLITQENVEKHQKENLPIAETDQVKTWIPNLEPQPIKDFGSLDQNIVILDGWNITEQGVFVPVSEIEQFEFNPHKFSNREQHRGEDGQIRCYIEFGDYVMMWGDFDKLFLFRTKDIYKHLNY